MSEQHGIDVAWPQGARYDWGQWVDRISFGMCKATEGTGLIDPYFSDNWGAMWNMRADHRLARWAYHFFHAGENPVAQAGHFVATVRAHGLLAGDNLVADFESTDPDTGLNDGVRPAEFAERGREFLHEVDALTPGHRLLVYSNPSFALAGNCAGMDYWGWWAADYGVSSPRVVAPWTRWWFWQTGDSPVDTDVFGGTEDELRAFTRMPDKR